MPGTPGDQQYVVEMRGIVKAFPGVLALNRVDIQLRPGEVHVLLGENGAGKSTLVKVLSGAHRLDSGEILIDGKPVTIANPQDAFDLGLQFIYQELNLVKNLTVARNLFLGNEPRIVRGIVDDRRLVTMSREYLKRLHIDLEADVLVSQLSVTQQKMVEIARALTRQAKVIVLDEPTDVLEERSRNELFRLIRELKHEHNVGFIYISHRYAEVAEIGDRVTILRDGANVGTFEIKDLEFSRMIELMIGGEIKKQYPDLRAPLDEDALRVDNITRGRILRDVSLHVKKGEIVGVTGLMAAGKTELGRAIAGVDRVEGGKIFVGGREVRPRSPRDGIHMGIAYLPEDRKTLGLIQGHSIRDNYAYPSLPRLNQLGIVKQRLLDSEVGDIMKRLSIKAPHSRVMAMSLSGGNQQKAVVAKWLGARCGLMIFDEPTRGIDINGKREIYHIMEELLERGVGILLLTSDYTEALEMSHRIIVMRHGAIVRQFARGEAGEADILREAIGEMTTGSPVVPESLVHRDAGSAHGAGDAAAHLN
jgi:ribose transport system ATP-binding protein